jgi:membrane protein implicated in regulation of membrane protease activity
MSDMTFYLNILAITIAILAALLLLISLLILVMRPIARRNAARTDLDQIGHEATVVKTIRPGKPGQIRYKTADGIRLANAESENIIRNGNVVLVLSVVQSRFRVRRLTDEERAATPAEKTAVDDRQTVQTGEADLSLQPVLPDIGSILTEDTYDMAEQDERQETAGQQIRRDAGSGMTADRGSGR